jgi:hypothetical protein
MQLCALHLPSFMCDKGGGKGGGEVLPIPAPKIGGPQEKMLFFQIASGPILTSPIHSNSSQYDSCKVRGKKMTTSLPTNTPKSAFFSY